MKIPESGLCALAVLVGSLAIGTAEAAGSPRASAPGNSGPSAAKQKGLPVPHSVEQLLPMMYQANLAEISLGELAQQRLPEGKISAYAERMVRDHTNANERVISLAKELNVALPANPMATAPAPMKNLMQKVKSASPAEFETQYVRAMIKSHRMVISTLQQARQQIASPEARELLEDLLPILEQHLALAKGLLEDMQTAS